MVKEVLAFRSKGDIAGSRRRSFGFGGASPPISIIDLLQAKDVARF